MYNYAYTYSIILDTIYIHKETIYMGTIIMQVHRALVIKGANGWPNNNWISLLSIKNVSL